MSVLERLQKISAQLFASTLKTYTLKDCIIHKRAKNINLVDMITGYPNKGVGFFVRRRTWPDNIKILLTDSTLKSHRHSRVKGIRYIDGKPFQDSPSHFNGTRKRSVWTYELGQIQEHETDNGMVYNQADYQAYFEIRKNKQKIYADVEEAIEENAEENVEENGQQVGEEQQQNDQ